MSYPTSDERYADASLFKIPLVLREIDVLERDLYHNSHVPLAVLQRINRIRGLTHELVFACEKAGSSDVLHMMDKEK